MYSVVYSIGLYLSSLSRFICFFINNRLFFYLGFELIEWGFSMYYFFNPTKMLIHQHPYRHTLVNV